MLGIERLSLLNSDVTRLFRVLYGLFILLFLGRFGTI
jgi:hypothetical protein